MNNYFFRIHAKILFINTYYSIIDNNNIRFLQNINTHSISHKSNYPAVLVLQVLKCFHVLNF
jgi:hypothetical protein